MLHTRPIHYPELNLNRLAVTRGTAYPPRVQIETTSRCNLKCPNCKRTADKLDAKDSLSAGTLAALRDLIPQLDSFTISGWGESMMGSAVGELLDLGHEHVVNTAITTNGTLLGKSRCEMLVAKRVNTVSVSLDAGTARGYARLRPGGVALGRVIEGILNLAQAREEQGSTLPRMGVSMVFCDDSADELLPLIRLVKLLPLDWLALQILYSTRFITDDGAAMLSKSSVLSLQAGMRLAEKLGVTLTIDNPVVMERDCGINIEAKHNLFYFPSRAQVAELYLEPTCKAPWENPFIDSRGDVYPCCIYPEAFGNIERESFETIWNNDRFVALRQGLVTANPSETCLNCRKTLWYRMGLDPHTASALDIGAPGLIGLGWYAPEQTRWGTPFRWGREHCEVFLHHAGEPLLYLEASALRAGTQVEVAIHGNMIATLTIGSRWDLYSLAIPSISVPALDQDNAEPRLHVTFRVLQPSRHPGRDAYAWPQRTLGLAVAQVGLCHAIAEITMVNQQEVMTKVERTKNIV